MPLVLPLMLSSFVFFGTWTVAKFISLHRAFEAQRHSHPRARPMASPIRIKR